MSYFYTNNRFNRGEVDPSVFGRQDLEFYPGACEEMLNWFPLPAGGLVRRPNINIIPDMSEVRANPFRTSRGLHFTFQEEKFYLVITENGTASQINCFMYHEASTGMDFLGTDTISTDKVIDARTDISLAVFGPAVFLTSLFFSPHRIFVTKNATWDVNFEEPTWLEELLGTVEVTNGSTTVTGEDTLFSEQLTTANSLRIEGVWYGITSIASNTSLTLSTSYAGISAGGLRIQKVASEVFYGGNPALCTFFQSRLVFFSTSTRPVTMWASKIQDPFTMVPGSVYDDAPIEYELLVETVDAFRWVSVADKIYLGGSQAEFFVGGVDDRLTPSYVNFGRVASIGGSRVPPVLVDSTVVFVSITGRQLQAVQYDLQRQGFVSRDLTQLAGHLFDNAIVSSAYRPPTVRDYCPRLFVVTSEGELRVCTFIEAEEVLAWHPVEGPPGYKFISVEASSDEVFLTLVNEEDGVYLPGVVLHYPDPATGHCLDFKQEATAVDRVLTVSFLDGYNVAVLDPELGWLGEFPVKDGAITLPEGPDYSEDPMTVGLPFASALRLLPSAIQLQTGLILSRKRRLLRTLVTIDKTVNLFVDNYPLLPQTPSPLPIRRSGTFELRFLGWVREDRPRFTVGTPYPALISSIVREVVL